MTKKKALEQYKIYLLNELKDNNDAKKIIKDELKLMDNIIKKIKKDKKKIEKII